MIPEPVNSLHRALTNLDHKATVLLGGSYVREEYDSNSDIDFYIIAPIYRLISLKKKISKLIINFAGQKLNCSLIPKLFYDQGWYYIIGKNLDGVWQESKINQRIIKANCFKLSLYHYYLAISRTGEASLRESVKSSQQLNALINLINSPNRPPDFTKNVSVKSLEQIKRELKETFKQNPDILNFHFSNYIIYNFKFLPRLNPLWLFKNPDKMLITTLVEHLNDEKIKPEFLSWIKKYIFPIYTL